MAKIKITDALGDLGSLQWGYTPDEMHTMMDESGNRKALYLDDDGGGTIMLKGTGFAYLDGDLLKGTVNKIIFRDGESNITATVSGGDFKAKQLDNLLTEGFHLGEFMEKIYRGKDDFTGSDNRDFGWTGKGDDTIDGKGGNDSINGELGDDRMTGGAGSDYFFFMQGGQGGEDVITDFDAKGGGEKQDYIAGNIDEVLSIKQVGDDLVLDYGGGNTLTLLDVDKSDFNGDDFAVVI
jgi:Ca2+-binding RTX toxin-like protein